MAHEEDLRTPEKTWEELRRQVDLVLHLRFMELLNFTALALARAATAAAVAAAKLALIDSPSL